ncbi:hypothetical protein Hypma_013100 [Hypsizygus marmoreus]|uniref:protein-tyrosine-phosphatase n=1 Tax=Hypsizygus marmoreus TaxID=39966 RepID=A0A369JFT4_HYPMA|nr:hypothetical protein Hypma_013100 [Hypsizygus marmoreus]
MTVGIPSVTEIVSGQIYLGNLSAALSFEQRTKLGTTHVLSACPEFPSTGPNHLTIPIEDNEYENILIHLPNACQFIQNALDQGGKVLVHCVMGISRSTTIVAAYLMKTRKMSRSAAIRFIKQRRSQVHPNYGFIKQLETFAECRYNPSSTNPVYIKWKRQQERNVTQYLNRMVDTAAIVPNKLLLSSEFPEDPWQAESLLLDSGTTHLLSISPAPIPTAGLTSLKEHYHIDIPNQRKDGLLVKLSDACEFIRNATQSGGQVLVYCQVESRACIVVCASLMFMRKMSFTEAFALVEDALPLFNPTHVFSRHLELFEACHYRPTSEHPLVKDWVVCGKSSTTTIYALDKSSIGSMAANVLSETGFDMTTSSTTFLSMKRKPELEDAEDAARKKVKPNLKDKLSGNEISSSSTSTPETSTLQPLLDFSSLNDTPSIQKRFDLIGRAILRDFYIVVQCGDAETLFEILELEFYLQKAECHEDPFTHGSEEQKISGKWYFHRAPRRSADSTRSSTSLTGYRGGTRKGLDLTLGAPCQVSSPFFASIAPTGSGSTTSTQPLLRGGALLRSIRRVSDSKVISGPSLLVDQVLLLSKAATIADLVDQKWDSDTSAFRSTPGPPERAASLFLRPRPPSASPKADIFRSPRIGLDLSHPGTTVSPTHPRVIFLSRPYRYFVHPHLLTANGRTQTFLGVLQSTLNGSFAGQTLHGMKLRREVARLTGLQNTTVASYISEYQGGIDYGKLKTWVGLKGASGSPSKYLSMMGTLERLRRESDAI